MSEEAKRKYRFAHRLYVWALKNVAYGTIDQQIVGNSQASHYKERMRLLVEEEYGTGVIDAATL